MKKRIRSGKLKQKEPRAQLFPTDFAARVYRAALCIPLGEVRSYKWVAAKAGSAGACRAVGQILKRNPYPLIIPCHRVINSDQKPGGYVFGRQRKKSLLALEKEIARCIISKK